MMQSRPLDSYPPPAAAAAARPWPRAVRPSPEADALFEASLTESETRAMREEARAMGDHASVERWSKVIWRRWAGPRYVATFPGARF